MRKGIVIAVLVALAAGWLLSGMLGGDEPTQPAATQQTAEAPAAFPVQVRTQVAETIERVLIAQGQAEPNRTVTMRAEASGKVAELPAKRGSVVGAGDVIARIDIEDRKARLAEAQALVERYERDYEASRQLAERGYQTDARTKEMWASLQAARASLRQMQVEIEKTTVLAPFAGGLNERPVELGDYLSVGDTVGTIVENDPLKVAFQVPQQDIGRIAMGAVATIDFVTNQSAPGVVTYIAAQAEEGTRTFRVELEVPNPDLQIPSGISAEVSLPLEAVPAHFVSPGLLTLDSNGTLGVIGVDEADLARFYPVQIVRAESDGVWISGPPASFRLVTVGQGFVRDGEAVVPVPEASDGSAAARQIPQASGSGS
jgi:multidrug efflux system membrane fusion protein